MVELIYDIRKIPVMPGIVFNQKEGFLMTIEEMKRRKKELGLSNEELAKISGVPASTVQKVLGGITRSPRYDTVCALEAVLNPEEKADRVSESSNYNYGTSALKEEELQEKKPGEYTIDDYYKLPDERRVELIDGVFYDMAAPKNIHQLLVGQMYISLYQWIQKHRGNCLPFVSPVDVQLDPSDYKTMVQPDVLVLCDRSKMQKGHIIGAPDLIVEILSPSSWRRDLTLKQAKYEAAGVREFWAISPKDQSIVVMNFEKNTYAVYNFHSQIPVGIWEDCTLDFQKVWEYVSFMYEDGDPENR